MSFTMRDILAKQLESLKANFMTTLVNLEQLIGDISHEYFNPEEAPTWVASLWSREANAAWDELETLSDMAAVDSELEYFTTFGEEEMNRIVDKFFDWTKRKTVNTKEAAELFDRSTSTIYRWIKQGKLEAKKVKGRWQIVA